MLMIFFQMSQYQLDRHKGPELLNTLANKVHSIFSSNFWYPDKGLDFYTEEPAWRTLRGLKRNEGIRGYIHILSIQ